MNGPAPALSFVLRPELPPEDLVRSAREVERAGFAGLWLYEDCFFAGGIAAIATCLAATDRIRVGLGVLPSPARNAAFAAMEIGALERIHPGRVAVGFGHGVAFWMRQVGAKPASDLAMTGETVQAVRSLLSGEQVAADGRYVKLDEVRLDHPPAAVPPIYLGVQRERSLALSGEVADGTILGETSSPTYLHWAHEQIGARRPHHLVVNALFSMDEDGDRARDALRPALAERVLMGGPRIELLGIGHEVRAMEARGGAALIAQEMPREWIDQLAVAGTPTECADAIRALGAAGADEVALVPHTLDQTAEQAGAALLPLGAPS